MSRDEVMGCARWASAFAGKHKDHRYYELVEDTIQPDFVFRYFAIKDEDGSVRAVQPFFIIDQDLLLGTNTRLGGVIDFIRRLWPRFMKMRTLMVGCAAGEGHLDGAEHLRRASAEILAASCIGRRICQSEHASKQRSGYAEHCDVVLVRRQQNAQGVGSVPPPNRKKSLGLPKI